MGGWRGEAAGSGRGGGSTMGLRFEMLERWQPKQMRSLPVQPRVVYWRAPGVSPPGTSFPPPRLCRCAGVPAALAVTGGGGGGPRGPPRPPHKPPPPPGRPPPPVGGGGGGAGPRGPGGGGGGAAGRSQAARQSPASANARRGLAAARQPGAEVAIAAAGLCAPAGHEVRGARAAASGSSVPARPLGGRLQLLSPPPPPRQPSGRRLQPDRRSAWRRGRQPGGDV